MSAVSWQVGELRHPFDDDDSAGQHGVHALGAVAGVDKGGPELAHFRQLEGGPEHAHVPVELGEDVHHVEGLELVKQKVEALFMLFQLALFPLDEGY